jgi:iron complex transport system permease protein
VTLVRSGPRNATLAAAATLALSALLVASLALGATALPAAAVLAALVGPLGTALGLGPVDPAVAAIVVELRLPRALLAAVVGAGLGLAGLLLQTATRNDLADPWLFGLSSGAAAGAALVLLHAGDVLGAATLPAAAFAGGTLAGATVLALARRAGSADPHRVVLAGLAVSFLFGALTHALVLAADPRAAHSVTFWTLGGLGLARWDTLWVAGVGLLAVAGFAVRRRAELDALLAGDETAHGLGVDPDRLRTAVFAVASLSTACFVALSGVIGFVGLMVPHLARAAAGVGHGRSIAPTALAGAALLLASDLLARTAFAPQELPVGVVTAALGATFMVGLLLRGER